MKYFICLLLCIASILISSAQHAGRTTPNGKFMETGKSGGLKIRTATGRQSVNSMTGKSLTTDSIGFEIGLCTYDLQTYHATQNRIYRYPDGTTGAVWIQGNNAISYTDRGTGYNFFDGQQWDNPPLERIENFRTGWPSYNPWESSGEIITCHTSTTNGVCIARRNVKNFGSWEFLMKSGPVGWETLLWSRAVTSGTNNEFLHLVALTPPVRNGGLPYNGQDGSLLYSRSMDGGDSWQISNVQFPETDTNYYYTLLPDCYSFAQPRADKLAFVYGDPWSDLFMMKSIDNGNSWTKFLIFKHPYPKFREETTLVTDTPWVVDGSINVVLDYTGKAHVFFGCIQVQNEIVNNQETTLFPFSDGLGYWNEDMPVLTTTCPDSLFETNQLIGYTQDINGNDTVGEFLEIARFNMSVTSMPNATIDENGNIFLFFTSVMENYDNGDKNYRHVYCRAFANGYWHDFVDLNADPSYTFDDCVFPTVAPFSDDYCYLMFQKDEDPGLFFYPEWPPTDNHQIFIKIKKSELLTGIDPISPSSINHVRNFPNPASGITRFEFENKDPGIMHIVVHNLLGQLVLKTPENRISAGSQSLSLDISGLIRGIYCYSVWLDGQKVSGKMIVD